MRGDDDHAVGIADDHVARPNRRIATGDRHIDVDRLVAGEIGRRRRTHMERRHVQPGISAASRSRRLSPARDAALHQARRENRAGRRGARITPAVDDEDGTGRHSSIACAADARDPERSKVIEVLARRNVAQCKRFADHGRLSRIERQHVLDDLVAESALEQRGADRCGGDRVELVARLRFNGMAIPSMSARVQLIAVRSPARRTPFRGNRNRSLRWLVYVAENIQP